MVQHRAAEDRLMADPFWKLKVGIAVVVTTVWALTFLALLFRPAADTAAYLSVQALMMLIAGALYADRLKRKNGGGS